MSKKEIETSPGGKTSVFIVDTYWAVLEGIKAALQENEEFAVVGTASDGDEAISRAKSLKPDIVIMDVSMPNLDGIEAATEIKKFNKNVRIIISSIRADKECVLSSFRAGVSGYILKERPFSDLILALKTVKAGGTYFSESVKDIVREYMEDLELKDRKDAREGEDGIVHLSDREKEVFPLLADGLHPREIGERLGISPKTVESHKYNIMEKLKVTSVTELTKIALRKDLIKP